MDGIEGLLFVGRTVRRSETSFDVTVFKRRKKAVDCRLINAGGASSVAGLMSSPLHVKNIAKSTTVWLLVSLDVVGGQNVELGPGCLAVASATDRQKRMYFS